MRTSFPMEGVSGQAIHDLLTQAPESTGFFPIGTNQLWHGGLHIPTATVASQPVVAIAEGRVVAYRITDDYLKLEEEEYSDSFVLIEHEYQSPHLNDVGKPKVRFKFYSLYMHLLPVKKYTPELLKRLPTVLAAQRVGGGNKGKAPAIALRSQAVGGETKAAIQKGEFVFSTRTQKRSLNLAMTPPAATPASPNLHVRYCDTGGDWSDGWVTKSTLAKVGDEFPEEPPIPEGAAGAIQQAREVTTKWRVEHAESGVFAVGLQGRTGPGTGPATRVFRVGTSIACEIAQDDYPWARVLDAPKEDGGEYTSRNEYVRVIGTGDPEPTITYCEEFNRPRGLVFPRSLYVKSGEVIGYPGKYYGESQIHVEVFTADDFASLQRDGAALATPYLQTARIEVPAGTAFSASASGTPSGSLSAPLLVDAIVDDGTTRSLIVDKQDDKLKIWNGTAFVWVKEASVTRHSPLAWPGFHPVDCGTGTSASQDAFFDLGETGGFFDAVFETIDQNHDKMWSASEMKAAMADATKYASLKGLVCRYPSEWQTDEAMGKWAKLDEIIRDPQERKRFKEFIKGLTWWDQVAAKVPGFPAQSLVWHFHPVAFIENHWLLPEEEVSFFVKGPDGRREVFRGPVPAPAPVEDNLGTGAIYYQTAENSEVGLGSKSLYSINGLAYLGLMNDGRSVSPGLYHVLNRPEYASYIDGLGLTERDKRVWTGITDNEGNMQSLNLWDNAFLSAGPFQQTVGVTYLNAGSMTHWLDVRGELQGALDSIRRSSPRLFQKYFGRHDLAVVDVAPEAGVPKGRLFLRGRPVVLGDKEEFRRFVWAYRFYIALGDVDFSREFLRQGLPRLAHVMSLSCKIDWAYQPQNPPGAPPTAALPPPVPKTAVFNVGTVFKSDLALALILDAHVNCPAWVEGKGEEGIWAKAIRDYLLESKLDGLPADNKTEWQLVRKIVANRAQHVSDAGRRSARILRYVKTADLEAMAADLGIVGSEVEERLKVLVESPKGLNIEVSGGAYDKVVKHGKIDVLSGLRG